MNLKWFYGKSEVENFHPRCVRGNDNEWRFRDFVFILYLEASADYREDHLDEIYRKSVEQVGSLL